MSDFKKQISEVKVVEVNKPRVYLKWVNTEKGRDKDECFERVDDGISTYYVNKYNRSSAVYKGEGFFLVLEEMYEEALNKLKLN